MDILCNSPCNQVIQDYYFNGIISQRYHYIAYRINVYVRSFFHYNCIKWTEYEQQQKICICLVFKFMQHFVLFIFVFLKKKIKTNQYCCIRIREILWWHARQCMSFFIFLMENSHQQEVLELYEPWKTVDFFLSCSYLICVILITSKVHHFIPKQQFFVFSGHNNQFV